MFALLSTTQAHPGIPFAVALFAIVLTVPPAVPAATFAPDVYVDMQEDPSDGYLSLREAVKKANATPAKDVIQLKAGNYALTAGSPPGGKSAYWAGDGRLKITGNLDIVGQGAGLTSLRMLPGTGGTSDRFLDISPGVTLSIKGVSIGAGSWGGRANRGGAALNAGMLILRNCYVAGNSATIAGGAVLNRGQLQVIGTTFQYNHAGRDGGGIFNDIFATATIESSNFNVNTAGSGQQSFGGHGGALFNAPVATASIRNSIMNSNHAYGTLGGHGGFAGAVFNAWGAVTVINNGVSNNFAHRLVSPGSYKGSVENYGGSPVWIAYEIGPLPPPWPPQPFPWP